MKIIFKSRKNSKVIDKNGVNYHKLSFKMLVGVSPVRISFAGGGTDLPEYYEKREGSVVATTISQYTYVIIQERQDNTFQAFSPDFQKHYKATKFHKIEIEDGTEIASSVIKYLRYKKGINVVLCSDAPTGSGLGTSGALTVNLVNMIHNLKGIKNSKKNIAETAFKIGHDVLNWPIGKQDEYISSYGGLNFIKFKKNKIQVTPIKMEKKVTKELENNLLLFFLGATRNSSTILSQQVKNIKQKKEKTMESLEHVNELSKRMFCALKKSDIDEFGDLLDEGWNAKKRFSKGVTNNKINKIYDLALQNGAIGGKLTGAGGGGHLLFYCKSTKRKNLIKKLDSIGLKHIPFKFTNQSPQVLNLYDTIGGKTS